MSPPWRAVPRALRSPLRSQHVRSITDARPFALGDVLLLRQKLDRSAPPILTRPLKAGGRIESHNGVIFHDEIVGKRVRDVVQTAPSRSAKPTTEYRLHEVKLEEYVRLTRRLVTPVYAPDARLIVELLDLHIEPFDARAPNGEQVPLEILEAGTGHGALTLYLSRAIHPANPPFSAFNSEEQSEASESAFAEWKHRRRAIIHTLDISAKYSAHAAKVVEGFRRGMYYNNVDFHVSDVSGWLQSALVHRNGRPFLSHAILDLPNAETHLNTVTQALRTDGCLIIFNPSISQIMECVKKIREDGLLLEMDNVIELGVNGGSGGREWNVRAVKPRANLTKQHDFHRSSSIEQDDSVAGDAVIDGGSNEPATMSGTEESRTAEQWSMICRPKVGDRIVGGGFLAVLRKQRDVLSPP